MTTAGRSLHVRVFTAYGSAFGSLRFDLGAWNVPQEMRMLVDRTWQKFNSFPFEKNTGGHVIMMCYWWECRRVEVIRGLSEKVSNCSFGF